MACMATLWLTSSIGTTLFGRRHTRPLTAKEAGASANSRRFCAGRDFREAAGVIDELAHQTAFLKVLIVGEAKRWERQFRNLISFIAMGYPEPMIRRKGHSLTRDISRPQYPDTLDCRYFVMRGRLWRNGNPALDRETRERLVKDLMSARHALGDATDGSDKLASPRRRVETAKTALGERGPVWRGRRGTDFQPATRREYALCRLL
jgi:hypothetical protein